MYGKIKDLPDYKDIQYNFFRKKVDDVLSRFQNLDFKYRNAFVKKLVKESSLVKDELFPPEMVRGQFRYNYFLFCNLKTGSLLYYQMQKLKLKLMYKFMEFLYYDNPFFTLKYKTHILKIKKRPNILDIYYTDDRIYIRILKKIKFNVSFKFSELEKFNEDD